MLFNFYPDKLSDVKKNILCDGLDVNQKNLCCENFSLMKARLLDTILSSYENFFCHRSPCENLTTSESIALKRFSKNKNIVI